MLLILLTITIISNIPYYYSYKNYIHGMKNSASDICHLTNVDRAIGDRSTTPNRKKIVSSLWFQVPILYCCEEDTKTADRLSIWQSIKYLISFRVNPQ